MLNDSLFLIVFLCGFCSPQSCGACGTKKGDESGVGEWDGQWPENYDAGRPFPAYAVNGTDARFAENVSAKKAPAIATE